MNISERIDAGKAQQSPKTASNMSQDDDDVVDMTAGTDPAVSDTNNSAKTSDGHISTVKRPSKRMRVMQFHKPAFTPTSPESAITPDFTASTEPPNMTEFKAHEGVMANSGDRIYDKLEAKETEPQDPVDPTSFAEQVRSKISSTLAKPDEDDPEDASVDLTQDPEPETKISDGVEAAEAADPQINEEVVKEARSFATDFYARVSQAHGSNSTEAPAPRQRTGSDHAESASAASAAIPLRRVSAEPRQAASPKIPLRRRAAYPTRAEAQQAGFAEQQAGNPLRRPNVGQPMPMEQVQPRLRRFDPVPEHQPQSFGNQAMDLHHAPQDVAEPVFEPDFISGPPSPEPSFLQPEPQPEPVAQYPFDAPPPYSDPLDNYASPAPQPEPQQPLHRPTEVPVSGFQARPQDSSQSAVNDDAPNESAEIETDAVHETDIFAKPDIDEDELLIKIYDLVQSELNNAWGENITLNIRQMVRDEIQAALRKKRPD